MHSKLTQNLLNKKVALGKLLNNKFGRNFGLISEYNERKTRKLQNGYFVENKPQFFVTNARPGNFGDHLDF